MRYGYLLPTRGTVMSSPDAPTLSAKVGSDVLGLARRAEASSFSSVWVGDSVLAKPRLDPLTTLASVAAATDAVGLGTAVHLPPLRNAVTLAHRTATLDQLSGGRLLFGVGVGRGDDVEREYGNVGVPFDRRGRKLDETLSVVSALWEGEPVDHDGEFHDLAGASIGFAPARSPPVYVASAGFDPDRGFPRAVEDRLAAHADGWLPIGLDPGTYADALDRVREVLADAGRDPDGVEPAYYLDVVIDDDEGRAIETARRFHYQYYPERSGLSDEWFDERGAFGPPEKVADVLAAYEDAGVERLVVRFPAANQREQLARFEALVG